MHFKVINCPDKDFKPYVYRAASFFAEELIKNTRIRNNCHTLIVFNDKITEYGYAEIKGYNTAKQARDFLIEIHPGIGVRNIFETLAHEMVHVKQMVRGHYRQEPKKRSEGVHHYWLGKRVNKEYIKRPWEIEAIGREDELVESLSQFLTKQKKKLGKKKA